MDDLRTTRWAIRFFFPSVDRLRLTCCPRSGRASRVCLSRWTAAIFNPARMDIMVLKLLNARRCCTMFRNFIMIFTLSLTVGFLRMWCATHSDTCGLIGKTNHSYPQPKMQTDVVMITLLKRPMRAKTFWALWRSLGLLQDWLSSSYGYNLIQLRFSTLRTLTLNEYLYLTE